MSRNQIVYGQWVFADAQIQNANIFLTTSLMSDSLEANTFTADVECEDRTIVNFERNAPLVYSHKGVQIGIFYVQDIVRIGPTTYTISATSAIGMLIEGLHYGGIYNGETVAEILPGICGSVPYEVKSSLQNITLYGWLPVASPRDNLSQVLFAIGATVKTDLNGILRIEGLWDGVSGSIGEDDLYRGQDVEYAAKVTRVVVTEHQYTEGTEEMELFNGTSQAGDIITFSEPMHNLSATGFTITESGSNYAILSAGTGVLTGQKYIHNTRQVSRDVAQANTENVVSVEDATLVSLVNSVAVAERLSNYYACRETIMGDISLNRQSTGDVVEIYHPYDRETVQACIKSLEINVSGNLRATAEQLIGFLPISTEDTEYYDYREVITEDSTWIVPDGVTGLTGVLISGGRGGYSGHRGEMVVYPESYNSTEEGYRGYDPGPGAEGGQGGEVGEGGHILQFTIEVSPGQSFQAHIGVGGVGGVHADTGSVQGSLGGATTFGTYTSDDGSPSPTGYTDIITGETYATPGDKVGIAGGKGSGSEGLGQYVKGPNVSDYDGTVWEAGPITNPSENVSEDAGDYHAEAGKGCGGGAAVGANGSPGGMGRVEVEYTWRWEVHPYTGPTGHGADAVKPAKRTVRGGGGNGGHGGGGEGGMGLALYNYNLDFWAQISADRGYPGNGSDGGDGGDGIIILYYRKPIETESGAIIGSDNKIRLDKYGRLMVG